MLNIVDIDNLETIKEIQGTFCEIYRQKDELIMTIQSNPYVKLCTYSVDKKIIGIIEYQDIYDRFELNNIFVLPEYRNGGIASILMEYMIQTGVDNKVKNITLEVREDNINAIKLYEKYGFIKKAIRTNYYGNCNGILMEKEMI
jgi:ribosomal-protein-alanine N-acetyltransferase